MKVGNIATALKDYAQAEYPTVYSDPSITFDSYKAMAFRGLEMTDCYFDYVNSLPNKQDTYNSSIVIWLLKPKQNVHNYEKTNNYDTIPGSVTESG